MDAIDADDEYSKMIVKLAGSASPWGEELKASLRGGMTNTVVTNSRAAIDAACLVFAESMLDDSAMSYCQVCAMLAPND